MYRISKPSPSSNISKFCSRAFHPSPTSSGTSPLFALQALANSRETQHFNKASRLSRVDHSPNLEIIRSSEVDPFKKRVPPPPDTRQPLTVEEQQAKVKNDAVPKLIPSALGRKQLESSLDRRTRGGSAAVAQSSSEAAAFNAGYTLAAEQDQMKSALSALEAKSETARLTHRAERKVLQSRIDALEHRETIFANLVVAAVFVGAIWWWRPQLEEVFSRKKLEAGVWNRQEMRDRLESRWNATMGSPAPAAVVRKSFDARDEVTASARFGVGKGEDAMTVPPTVLSPSKQADVLASQEEGGNMLSKLFWK